VQVGDIMFIDTGDKIVADGIVTDSQVSTNEQNLVKFHLEGTAMSRWTLWVGRPTYERKKERKKDLRPLPGVR
jgi:hypothetical protein